MPRAGEGDRGLSLLLLRNSRGARASPCTMSYHAQPEASCRTGFACLIVWPMCTGEGRRRCMALGVAALYHCPASVPCEMLLMPMQQIPCCGRRCLQMSAGPAPRPPEAHHCPVTMSAPGMRASLLQIVVTLTRRPSRNSGKPVAEAHQSHHDTMLAQCHGGLRGRSVHALEARGRTLRRSPLSLKRAFQV